MTNSDQRCQVVLLVDISSKDESRSCNDNGQSLRLSALKLLTHFSCVDENFRWGFKFFNSQRRYSRLERHDFKEFSKKSFEEFEREFDQLLENAKRNENVCDNSRPATPATDVQCGSEIEVPQTDDDIAALDKIRRALQEVACEFHWDSPDITSPVKRGNTRVKKKAPPDVFGRSHKRNYVFMFTDCPHTTKDVENFAGVDSMQELLNTIFPKSLFQQYHNHLGIQVHWVDVSPQVFQSENKSQNVAVGGLNLINNALALVGGGVILLNSLINMGGLANSLLMSLLDDTSVTKPETGDAETTTKSDVKFEAVDLSVPTSSVLNFFCGAKHTAVDSDEVVLGLEMKGNWRSLTKLQMQKIAATPTNQITKDPVSRRGQKTPSPEPLHFSFQSSLKTQERQRVLVIQDTKLGQGIPSKRLHSTLTIKGLVLGMEIPLESLLADMVYSVVVRDDKSDFSFSEFMLQLTQQKLAVIVEYLNSGSGVPHLCVMQPLTSIVATLTFMNCNSGLSLEKLLSFRQNSTKDRPHNLEAFITSSVHHILDSVMDSETKFIPKPKSGSAKSFSFSYLEPWFKPALVGKDSDDLISELGIGPPFPQSEIDVGLKLQSVYRKAKASRYTDIVTNPRRATNEEKLLRRSPRKRIRSEQPGSKEFTSATSDAPILGPRRKKSVDKGFTAPCITSGRAAMIFKRKRVPSQQQILNTSKEEDTVSEKKMSTKEKSFAILAVLKDLGNMEDLKLHIQKSYQEGLDSDASHYTLANTLVQTVHTYCHSRGTVCANKEAIQFVQQHLLCSNEDLRKKYSTSTNEDIKLREYQLQVFLRMELECLSPEEELDEEVMEERVQDMSMLLRTMSFIKDASFLSLYLQDELLGTYQATLPRVLGALYEELMLPVPSCLEASLSHNDDESSATTSVAPLSVQLRSHSSSIGSEVPASQRSSRSRKLVRYSSFSFESKRQIAVPLQSKSKQAPVQRKRTQTGKSAQKSKIVDKRKGTSDARKVKRNLFEKDDRSVGKMRRHQSVAVMECRGKRNNTPKKRTPQKHHRPKTPKTHHVLRTKAVSETPVHKQLKQAIWHKQERERKRAHTVPEKVLIEESPEKPLGAKVASKLRSPGGRGKPTLKRNSSFYSKAPDMKSRNVEKMEEKYDLLEKRMTSRRLFSPQKAPPDILKSPPGRRITTTFLFTSLMASPSPKKGISKMFSGDGLQSNEALPESFTSPPLSMRRDIFKSPLRSMSQKLESRNSSVPDHPSLPKPTDCTTPQKLTPHEFGTPKKRGDAVTAWLEAGLGHVSRTPNRASRSQTKLFSEAFTDAGRSHTCVGPSVVDASIEERVQPRRIRPNTCKDLSQAFQSSGGNTNAFSMSTFCDVAPTNIKNMNVMFSARTPKKLVDEGSLVPNTPPSHTSKVSASSPYVTRSKALFPDSGEHVLPSIERSDATLLQGGALAKSSSSGNSVVRRISLTASRSNSSKENVPQDDNSIPFPTRKRKLSTSPNQELQPKTVKRRCFRTATMDAVDSNSDVGRQDYFSTQELFIGTQDESHPPSESEGKNTNISSSLGSNRSHSSVTLGTSSLEDACDSPVFPLLANKHDAVSKDNNEVGPASPIFVAKLTPRAKESKVSKDETCDMSPKMQNSSPGKDSPSHASKVAANQEMAQDISTPGRRISPRKYSPNISAKSIVHLISSPLLGKPTMRGRRNPVQGLGRPEKQGKRSSRRSLY